MSIPILATKLFVPPPRSQLIERPRLIEQLNEGLLSGRKLPLNSAHAGFGKTTLIIEWIASCGRPTAWLSLDEEDCDLSRFMTYLIAALQTIAPRIGEEALGLLQASQLPPIEYILTVLVNEITVIQNNFIFADTVFATSPTAG